MFTNLRLVRNAFEKLTAKKSYLSGKKFKKSKKCTQNTSNTQKKFINRFKRFKKN